MNREQEINTVCEILCDLIDYSKTAFIKKHRNDAETYLCYAVDLIEKYKITHKNMVFAHVLYANKEKIMDAFFKGMKDE